MSPTPDSLSNFELSYEDFYEELGNPAINPNVLGEKIPSENDYEEVAGLSEDQVSLLEEDLKQTAPSEEEAAEDDTPTV